MTAFSTPAEFISPTVLAPEEQKAVWFLGALVTQRVSSESTGGALAVLEHRGERGYSSPLHRHDDDDETFLVLDGELRVEVGGEKRSAGPGSIVVLPKALPHAFVVTSPTARFLTLHTPGGFDTFTLQAGSPAAPPYLVMPSDLPPLDPAELAKAAASFGIEILGPPPTA
ncbi:cupin domain-containing protein [Streptomyces adustus]|uniref:Cupin domain-containing protein n=1 Tax=Streptomyces adustus TaxID=1609272 RepID=A0A5N8V801_9ACTN|nr:cupin domain-containing protein [Streptomyces adustus]MPY30168.1 cupin domain-containing protein [Streptomyces adustus]